MKCAINKFVALLLILAMLLPLGITDAYASDGLTSYVATYGNEITVYGDTIPDTAITMKLVRISDNNIRYTNEIKSDSEGNYKLMFVVEPEEYKLVVGAIGLIVEKKLTVNDVNAGTATVRVEGSKNTLLKETRIDIKEGQTTYIEAIKKALDQQKVNYDPKDQDIINGIGPELEGLNSAKSWQWMVNGGGGMSLPTDLVKSLDNIVLVVGDLWNPTITKLDVSPDKTLVKNSNFTVKLEKLKVDEFGDVVKSPVANQLIKFDTKESTTNESGEAVFTADKIGTFDISCEPVSDEDNKITYIRPATISVTVNETGDITKNTVLLSIDTKTIGGGFFIKDKAIEYERGDTVYDILVKGMGEDNLRVTGSESSVYVSHMKIDGKWLGEFDHGSDSGWMINVDGYYIEVSAGAYRVKPGDHVNWRYTTNLGADLGAPMYRDVVNSEVNASLIKNSIIREFIEDILKRSLKNEQIKKVSEKAMIELIKSIDFEKIKEDEAKSLIKDLDLTINYLTALIDDITMLDKTYFDIFEIVGKLKDKLNTEDSNKVVEEYLKIITKIINIKSTVEVTTESVNTSKLNELKNIVEFNENLIAAAERAGISSLNRSESSIKLKFNDGIIKFNAKELMSENRDIGLKKTSDYFEITVSPELKGKKPMTIKIPYTGKSEYLTVMKREGGKKVNMGGIYDPKTKYITFTSYGSGKYYIAENHVDFSDIKGYEWAENSIESMASKGILNGKANKLFVPQDNLTRAEFATIMVRILKAQNNDGVSRNFEDVNKDAWYKEFVNIAVKNNIMNGKSDFIFDPDGNITRQELSVVMANVLEEAGYINDKEHHIDKFNDQNDIASWAAEGSNLCIQLGLIQGSNGRFKPNDNATRAECAVMLERLYNMILN